MIDYITGEVVEKKEDSMVIENMGMGYLVYLSSRALEEVNLEEKIKIYTYYHVKEDDRALYGFLRPFEREIFQLITTVSGVGVKLANRIFSQRSSSEIVRAIYNGDIEALKGVKGLGQKNIQKIILEIKDKVVPYLAIDEDDVSPRISIEKEVYIALKGLGYKEKEIKMAYSKVKVTEGDMENIEDFIKKCLIYLSKF